VLGLDGKPRIGVGVRFTGSYRLESPAEWGVRGDAVTNALGEYVIPGLLRGSEGCVGYCGRGISLPERNDLRTGQARLDKEVVAFEPLKIGDKDLGLVEQPRGPKSVAGQPAPAWSCQAWFNSPPLQLESLRGKIILLNFWATWCGPCIAKLPQIQAAHELFADRGVVVIGIHHNSVPRSEVETFIKSRKIAFPIGLDTAAGDTSGRYHVTSWPTEILIDRAGRVVDPGGDVLARLRELVLYDGAPGDR
jgi:thiol-disulfide isomerase/thioredoxin